MQRCIKQYLPFFFSSSVCVKALVKQNQNHWQWQYLSLLVTLMEVLSNIICAFFLIDLNNENRAWSSHNTLRSREISLSIGQISRLCRNRASIPGSEPSLSPSGIIMESFHITPWACMKAVCFQRPIHVPLWLSVNSLDTAHDVLSFL